MSNEENKKVEHKVIVDTKDDVLRKDDEISDRINRLFGVTEEIPKKGLEEYDPKELASVRKKLLFLFGMVILVGIVIVVLLVKPFFNSVDNPDSPKDPITGESGDAGNQDEDYLGELDLSLEVVSNLVDKVTFSQNTFLQIDLFPLYSNESVETISMPNDIKLYLFTRDYKFVEILNASGVKEYVNSCDTNGISIDCSKFDEAVQLVLGPGVVIGYRDINYLYIHETGSQQLSLKYSNDKYVINCSNASTSGNLQKFIQQKTVKAIGTEEGIEIYQKVVFISQQGVFKDTNFTTLITNDRNAVFDDYIQSGNTYKYIFIKSDNDYYLSKIELVKEDN